MPVGVFKNGGAVEPRHIRGQSTDVSSVPKSQPKSIISGGEHSSTDANYIHVKLTKDVLTQFENYTRMSSAELIHAYLVRCSQEPGEIDGLMSSSSSDDDRDSSYTNSEEDEGSYGDEGEDNGEDEDE